MTKIVRSFEDQNTFFAIAALQAKRRTNTTEPKRTDTYTPQGGGPDGGHVRPPVRGVNSAEGSKLSTSNRKAARRDAEGALQAGATPASEETDHAIRRSPSPQWATRQPKLGSKRRARHCLPSARRRPCHRARARIRYAPDAALGDPPERGTSVPQAGNRAALETRTRAVGVGVETASVRGVARAALDDLQRRAVGAIGRHL